MSSGQLVTYGIVLYLIAEGRQVGTRYVPTIPTDCIGYIFIGK